MSVLFYQWKIPQRLCSCPSLANLFRIRQIFWLKMAFSPPILKEHKKIQHPWYIAIMNVLSSAIIAHIPERQQKVVVAISYSHSLCIILYKVIPQIQSIFSFLPTAFATLRLINIFFIICHCTTVIIKWIYIQPAFAIVKIQTIVVEMLPVWAWRYLGT